MVAGAVAVAVGRMLREQPLTRERYGPGPRDVAPAVASDYVGARVMHTAARLSASPGAGAWRGNRSDPSAGRRLRGQASASAQTASR